jgi:peroxiredoxin
MRVTSASLLCLAAVFSALPASAGDAGDAAAGPVPARAARMPEFKLPDLEGKDHASAEWKGKILVLDFWATWCAGCRQSIPALSRLQEKFGPQGLAVVGISLDKGPSEKIAKFARKLKTNYLVLRDAEDTLSKTLGFEGIPSLYMFGRRGELIKALPNYTSLQDKELEDLVAAQFPGK